MGAQINPTSTLELSVIIPVLQFCRDFSRIASSRLVAALEPAVKSFEIIAVVDGCRVIASAEVIGGTAAKDPRVRR